MTRNKLYSMLLSLVVAFGLWLYVKNNVSIEDNNTFYNIPVVMEGEAILNEENLMITSVSANTVSLNLSGARSDLSKLDSSKLAAKVDLSGIKEPGERIPLSYTITFPSDVSPSDFTQGNKNPGAIYVDVDYRRVTEIPVLIKWTGNRSEDYIYDTENAVLDNNTVTISGPASVVDTIDHARVEIDLTEQVKSISQNYRYTLCDVEGNPVDAGQITTNLEEVRLEMQIQKIQEIRLNADVVYGGGANEHNTTVEISPATIRVSGGEAVLAELGDSLTICTINLADLDKNVNEQKYTLTLPEGVTNLSNITEAKATIQFNNLGVKEFVVTNIRAVNVPEGMQVDLITEKLTVTFRGAPGDLSRMVPEDVEIIVDFAEAEEGTTTFKPQIQWSEDFKSIGPVGTYSISATLEAQ